MNWDVWFGDAKYKHYMVGNYFLVKATYNMFGLTIQTIFNLAKKFLYISPHIILNQLNNNNNNNLTYFSIETI